MTDRERQQLAYEIAFTPTRLDGLWRVWKDRPDLAQPEELKALDEAAMLHLPLPEGKASTMRAVYRIALYQAGAAPFAMRSYIRNVRRKMARPSITASQIPDELIADVALPGYHIPKENVK